MISVDGGNDGSLVPWNHGFCVIVNGFCVIVNGDGNGVDNGGGRWLLVFNTTGGVIVSRTGIIFMMQTISLLQTS